MPDPVKFGSKINGLESQIKSIQTEKENLRKTIRGMVKGGHRGDVGLVKEMESMDSKISKLQSKVKTLKGSGSGKIVKAKTGGKVSANYAKNADNIKKFGGDKVTSGSEKRGTFSGMSNDRQDKITRRNDVLAERAIRKAQRREDSLSRSLGRELTPKERSKILDHSKSSNKRTSNSLKQTSKVGDYLRSINPFKKKK